jgi:purine-nucleoside phosphorylase
MTEAYHPQWQEIIKRAAKKQSLKLGHGVYAGVLGPTYETPAEIHMLRTLGADMVGMSTVPEVIAANHMGIKVCGISCITNMAAGLEGKKLAHEDIKDQAQKVMKCFVKLLEDALALYSEQSAS